MDQGVQILGGPNIPLQFQNGRRYRIFARGKYTEIIMIRTKHITTAAVNTSIFAKSVKDITLTFSARPAKERIPPGPNREAVAWMLGRTLPPSCLLKLLDYHIIQVPTHVVHGTI